MKRADAANCAAPAFRPGKSGKMKTHEFSSPLTVRALDCSGHRWVRPRAALLCQRLAAFECIEDCSCAAKDDSGPGTRTYADHKIQMAYSLVPIHGSRLGSKFSGHTAPHSPNQETH